MGNPRRRKLKNPYADEIPFRPDGSVPWKRPKRKETHWGRRYDYHTRTWIEGPPIDWRENKPFKACLKFDKVVSKRSSVQFLMRNTETEATYYVSEEHFNEMMDKTTWVMGVCLGEWIFHSYRGFLSIVPAEKAGEFKDG